MARSSDLRTFRSAAGSNHYDAVKAVRTELHVRSSSASLQTAPRCRIAWKLRLWMATYHRPKLASCLNFRASPWTPSSCDEDQVS